MQGKNKTKKRINKGKAMLPKVLWTHNLDAENYLYYINVYASYMYIYVMFVCVFMCVCVFACVCVCVCIN